MDIAVPPPPCSHMYQSKHPNIWSQHHWPSETFPSGKIGLQLLSLLIGTSTMWSPAKCTQLALLPVLFHNTPFTVWSSVIEDKMISTLSTLLPSSALFTCVSMIKEPFPLKIANCVSDIFYPNNLSGITNLQAEWHFGVNSLIMGISAIINKRGEKCHHFNALFRIH